MFTIKCHKHGVTKAQKNGSTKRCAECNNERMRAKHQELKQRAIDYKGNQCERCGYNKCPDALDFHHLNSSEKDFEISRCYKRSRDVLKAEIDKCVMVCANCHREIHAGMV